MFLAEIIPEGEHHMKRIQRTLTSAELLALLATPVQLLPSPGPNKRYVVFAAFALYNFVTTPYTMNAVQFFYVANDSSPLTFLRVDGVLVQSQNFLASAPTTADAADGAAAFDKPMKLRSVGPAELTAGDGTFLLVVYYAIEGNT